MFTCCLSWKRNLSSMRIYMYVSFQMAILGVSRAMIGEWSCHVHPFIQGWKCSIIQVGGKRNPQTSVQVYLSRTWQLTPKRSQWINRINRNGKIYIIHFFFPNCPVKDFTLAQIKNPSHSQSHACIHKITMETVELQAEYLFSLPIPPKFGGNIAEWARW